MNPTPPPATEPRAIAGQMYGVYLIALAICLIGNLAIRMGERGGWLPGWASAIIAVLTTAPLVIAAFMFWGMLRRDLDEMLQRIVLEGMALALMIYIPLAGLYVNLRTAGVWTPRLDPPDILFAPAMLVAAGIAIAWRRYR